MKNVIKWLCILSLVALVNCAMMINGTDDNDPVQVHKPYTIRTNQFFPFESTSNWWKFSEKGGNPLSIKVIDTISDDNVMFYRVSFMENLVDTTDDWFKRISGDVMFGASLTGSYYKFIPSSIQSNGGVYTSGSNEIRYSYYDSVIVKGQTFKSVISLQYATPVIHGFDQILFAENIGIVMMKDTDGRWPVSYVLDSCSLGGIIRRF